MNKIEIIPAIMPKNLEDLKDKLSLVRGKTPSVQLDLMDGVFVPERTWPYFPEDNLSLDKILKEEESLPFWQDFDFELDLMIQDAYKDIEKLIKLGSVRLIFHFQSIGNIKEFKKVIKNIDPYIKERTEIGLAFSVEDNEKEFDNLKENIDFVQFMGIIKIGYQGEGFDQRVIEKISSFKEKYPDVLVSVDGGVCFDNACELINAGAERLVSGSCIFKGDVGENIERFEKLLKDL